MEIKLILLFVAKHSASRTIAHISHTCHLKGRHWQLCKQCTCQEPIYTIHSAKSSSVVRRYEEEAQNFMISLYRIFDFPEELAVKLLHYNLYLLHHTSHNTFLNLFASQISSRPVSDHAGQEGLLRIICLFLAVSCFNLFLLYFGFVDYQCYPIIVDVVVITLKIINIINTFINHMVLLRRSSKQDNYCFKSKSFIYDFGRLLCILCRTCFIGI